MATEWPPIGKIAANSAYDMFSFHNYLIIILVFPTSVFGEGISFQLHFFLIIAYFYLNIIHSASILELSTNLFLKFYKSDIDFDALLFVYHPGVVLSI